MVIPAAEKDADIIYYCDGESYFCNSEGGICFTKELKVFVFPFYTSKNGGVGCFGDVADAVVS